MLKFIGRGSAFFTQEGNTAAYAINDSHEMFLIDCGETVFSSLQQSTLLDDVQQVCVAITHNHPDHMGSLGSLIFYLWYIKKIQTNICCLPENQPSLWTILSLQGVSQEMVDFVSAPNMQHISNFQPVPISHMPGMHCCGFLFQIQNKSIFYTGDTNSCETVAHFAKLPSIDQLYTDCCLADFAGNPHLCIHRLAEAIPPALRFKVFCMHIDTQELEHIVETLGFQLVTKK